MTAPTNLTQAADRDALLLFALTGLGYQEIATATGVPVGTVRSRLHRVRRQLSRELRSNAATNCLPERSIR